MHLLLWYPPHMLAAYMDFGVGILIATLLWTYGFKQVPTFGVLFAGGALALLPDADVIIPILYGRVEGDHHQLVTHYPLFMVPLAAITGYWRARRKGAWLAGLCVTWHFVHDSPEFGGGGIAWAAPLSYKYWTLTGAEIPPYWPDGEAYVRQTWLKPNMIAARELAVGTLALVLAALLLRSRLYYAAAVCIPACVWGTALFLWYGPLQVGTALANP